MENNLLYLTNSEKNTYLKILFKIIINIFNYQYNKYHFYKILIEIILGVTLNLLLGVLGDKKFENIHEF